MGGDERLAGDVAHQREEGPGAPGVELRGDVVQQHHRRGAQAVVQGADLGELQAQDDGPLLPLAGELARRVAGQMEGQVAAVRADVAEAARPVAGVAGLEAGGEGGREGPLGVAHLGLGGAPLYGLVPGGDAAGQPEHQAAGGRLELRHQPPDMALGGRLPAGQKAPPSEVDPGSMAHQQRVVDAHQAPVGGAGLAQERVARLLGAQVGERRRHEGRLVVGHRPIEEVPPPLGALLDDAQIVGEEGDDVDEGEEVVGMAAPSAVDGDLAGAAGEADDDVVARALALQAGLDAGPRLAMGDHLDDRREAKGAPGGAQVEGLEEVGLALAVAALDDHQLAAELEAERREVAQARGAQVADVHGSPPGRRAAR